jgi:6-phosphogluconolactonase
MRPVSSTGALTATGTAPAGMAPSFMAFAPSKKFAYALDEVEADAIIAYSVDGSNGALKEVGRLPAGGMGAAHVAVHPSGKWIATAHYDSNNVTINELKADGTVGIQTDMKGECVAAHETVFISQGSVAFTACLTSNYVGQWKFAGGKLTANVPPRIDIAGNPRHLVFDQAEKHAYVLSELENVITAFDVVDGKLTKPRALSSVDATGMKMAAAEIVIHPNGKFLYASNRTDNSVGIFSIDAATGDLGSVEWQKMGVEWVRGFAIDPSGNYLIAANQKIAKLVVFKIDGATGKLTAAGAPMTVPDGPAYVGVVTLP